MRENSTASRSSAWFPLADVGEPRRGKRRTARSSIVFLSAVTAVCTVVTAFVLVGLEVAHQAARLDRQQTYPRVWIDQTLGPPPPAPPPSGAILGVTLPYVVEDLEAITGASLTPYGSVHAGHNVRTVTSDGHQLTVDLVPLGQSGTYVQSVTCEYHTTGPSSVDSGMVNIVQRCLFASLDEHALSPTARADLTDYARTGQGTLRQLGVMATVRITDDASTYGVTVSGG